MTDAPYCPRHPQRHQIALDLCPETGLVDALDLPAVRHHFLLPRNLAGLAALAPKDSMRYAINSIQIQRLEGKSYRACVTDGSMLAQVTGTDPHDVDKYPDVPALTLAPNSATTALVDPGAWGAAFKAVPKTRKTGGKPVLETVAIVLAETVTTLVTTDGAGAVNVQQPANVEGRYPAVQHVFPGKAPTVTLDLDAKRLQRLLAVASDFAGEEGIRITLEVRDDKTPLVIRAQREGQEFIGLLMMLGTPK